jgi:hypothetical protein
MVVLKKDKEKVDEIMFEGYEDFGWPEEYDNENGTVTLTEYEANYGYIDQRKKLAEAGIVFEGHYGAGGEYLESLFVGYENRHIEITAMDGSPAAIVNKDGSIDKATRLDIQDYYQTFELVEKYFKDKGINADS